MYGFLCVLPGAGSDGASGVLTRSGAAVRVLVDALSRAQHAVGAVLGQGGQRCAMMINVLPTTLKRMCIFLF